MLISSRSARIRATFRGPDAGGMWDAAARMAATPLALSSAPGLLRTLSRWAMTTNVSRVIGPPRVASGFVPTNDRCSRSGHRLADGKPASDSPTPAGTVNSSARTDQPAALSRSVT